MLVMSTCSFLACLNIESSMAMTIVAETISAPTLIGAGSPTNGEYQQGLQQVALTGYNTPKSGPCWLKSFVGCWS